MEVMGESSRTVTNTSQKNNPMGDGIIRNFHSNGADAVAFSTSYAPHGMRFAAY